MFIFLLILHIILGVIGAYLCFKHYFFIDRVLWKKSNLLSLSDDFCFGSLCFLCLFIGIFSIISYYFIFKLND